MILPAREIYGKIMSISDELMWKYYELCTDLTPDEIKTLKTEMEAGTRHPKAVKDNLAKLIIRDFHDDAAAEDAAAHFEQVFARKEVPDEMPDIRVTKGEEILLAKFISDNGLAASGGEARRLIKQGGVTLDGDKVSDPAAKVAFTAEETILKVGKRKFARIITG